MHNTNADRQASPSQPPPRIALGARGEALAATHLEAAGMVVLARNWRIAEGELRGELDVVARDGDALVIVEVKTRSGVRFGSPVEAVTSRKQAKLRALAGAFLRQSGIRVATVRFDVIGVLVEADDATVTHLRGAF